ncbi:MAG: glycoside hydrolase family 38 C-terminal domain-containing protein [Eubacteriales bacterium]
MKPRLHIVPTFHHDIAYLRPESWYRTRAFEILDRALAIMEQDENYTFTVEQVYFFRDYWRERADRQNQLRALVKRGQLHFSPGFWVVPDMSMPSGESLFMQITLGRRFLRDSVGYAPRTAFIADCWGHHAQLPQIMRQGGYDYYTFSRCMYPTWDIENYRWQGLDGTEIRTHWMSTAYAGISFPDNARAVNAEELHWEQASREGILKLVCRNAEHCGNDTQILPAGGDMRMPAASAPSIVRELQKDEGMPPLAFSDLDSALDQIDFGEKPVFRGEFIGSLKGSFAANIDLKIRNKQAENLLYSLELLSVLRRSSVDFLPLWETVLKNQFHDTLCGTLCDEALAQARAESDAVLSRMEEIRAELTGGKAVYRNVNNFPVTEIRDSAAGVYHLRAGSFGEAEAEALAAEETSLPAIFENEFYRAEIDRRGYITVLKEKKSGEAVVKAPQIPFGSLQMQADGGDNWVEFEYPCEQDPSVYAINIPDPYDRSALATHAKAMIARDGVATAQAYRLGNRGLRIVQHGALRYWATEIPFTITVTFCADSPRIEYHTTLQCSSRRVRIRAAFPAAWQKGEIRHQIPYGIAPRGEGPQAAQMFMDYASDAAGIALLNRGIPHNNTENGIMMLTLMRSVAMEYKCQSGDSYGLGRTFTLDYAIVPHPAGDDREIWRQALSFNRPVLESGADIRTDFAVEGAFLSAVRNIEEDLFVRVFSGVGEETECTIRVPDGFDRYAFTDGCMEYTQSLPVSNRCITLRLHPYAVQGIRFIR